MPPLTRIICLANSRKHGAYCVAGIAPGTGEWVRPVSHLEDGRVERSMLLVRGRAPRLCEVLDIPLDAKGPDFGFEGENRSILPGPWKIAGSIPPEELIPRCSRDVLILHNRESYVTVEFLKALPSKERRTLQLLEAFDFQAFSTGLSAQGGHKWDGTFISHAGERLRARITDPVLVERLEGGYQPGSHCLVTASLSMPYRPEGWKGDGLPCWKLIAGVIELELGTWAGTRPPRVHAGERSTHSKARPFAGTDDTAIKATLKKVFGFDTFLPYQEEVVRAILRAQDCFVVMPTGGGKSLCFQLPAHLLPGTCMVISPLISLMKDQVDAARSNGLRAGFINSSQTDLERIEVFRDLEAGRLDLLYVSPERFAMETFLNNLRRASLCLAAIDEAHCISEWGHDFRPDYLYLSEIVKHFPDLPVAAFTATATRRVQQNIVERLGLRSPHIVRASFDRPNLFYEVAPKADVDSQVLDFIKNRKGEPGIVYRTTRDDVDDMARLLQGHGLKALPYHAGLGDDTRKANQEAFNSDEVEVMVATIAFGMGIDKPNVRFVVHADLPKSMEAYYQETGRAGRDGEPAHCLLLFSRGDIPRMRHFIDQIGDEGERRRSMATLNEMVNYAATNQTCLRRRILAYFGEEYGKDNCGACDVCTGEMEAVDLTTDARMILSAMARTRERFGAGHIIDIVKGADTKKIRSFRHHALPTYGVGRSKDKRHWRQVIDDLLSLGIITQSQGDLPVLELTPKAQAVLKGREGVQVLRRKEVLAPKAPARGYEQGLFEHLRTLRLRLAANKKVPPYVIFSDRSLREMAVHAPHSRSAFLLLHGVGETKWELYGEAFLEAIKSYLAAHPEAGYNPASGGRAEPTSFHHKEKRKSCTVEETWALIQRGLAIQQIALKRGLTEQTVVAHIERLILEGRDIDIDRFVRPEVRRHVEELVKTRGRSLLSEIVENASIPVSFDEARLARAWAKTRPLTHLSDLKRFD
ncbi:MAG: DNA helicase RecQ [Thermodesulfobacteriota bacterium]